MAGIRYQDEDGAETPRWRKIHPFLEFYIQILDTKRISDDSQLGAVASHSDAEVVQRFKKAWPPQKRLGRAVLVGPVLSPSRSRNSDGAVLHRALAIDCFDLI